MNKLLSLVWIAICLTMVGCGPLVEKKEKRSKKKDGLVEQYRADGKLKTSINLKNGKRHGLAKSYYKSGGLRQQIDYVNNVKHGLAITYYENGKKHQETPYYNGEIHGIQKKYRLNGDIMAEVPYNNGQPCAGLVEYLLNGEKKKQYPTINIRSVDKLITSNEYSLVLSLSDGSKHVEFYSGQLTDEGCLPHYAIALGETAPGEIEVKYELPEQHFVMEELHFIAKVKTRLGNPYIIETSHYLAIENK